MPILKRERGRFVDRETGEILDSYHAIPNHKKGNHTTMQLEYGILENIAKEPLGKNTLRAIFFLIQKMDTWTNEVRCSPNNLAQDLGIHPNNARIALKELQAINLIQPVKDNGGSRHCYRFSQYFLWGKKTADLAKRRNAIDAGKLPADPIPFQEKTDPRRAQADAKRRAQQKRISETEPQ
jgi:hypothetical protein